MATRGHVTWGVRLLLASVVIALLAGSAPPASARQSDDDARQVRLARPTWDTGWFQSEIYRQLLTRLGYEVVGPDTMENEEFYAAVAAGEVDLWASGWFPLHEQYLTDETTASSIERVGTQVEAGALQGYFMDIATADDAGVTSIEALTDPELAAQFDLDGNGRADLIGCNIDWACADIIDHHLDAYGLTQTVEQIQGDHSLLMREAVDRYRNGEPVLYYTFTPNWTVGELAPGTDVRWLETPFATRPDGQMAEDATDIAGLDGCASDPCRTGWPANDIQVVANSAFLDEHPPARRLLEAVEIPLADILEQNTLMVTGEGDFSDIERHARQWIERNAALVERWLTTATPVPPDSADDQRAQGVPDAQGDGTLRVAARAFPPFVIYENRQFGGFSVELMQLVAADLDVELDFYGVNSIAKEIDDVQRGAADAAVAGIGITAEHEARVDFTHPIVDTGLQIMVPVDTGGGFAQARRLVGVLGRSNLLWWIALFVGTLLVSAHVVWWFERRNNPEFAESYRRGIWDSFWWSAVTVTTVGYGDKAPRGDLGKWWALMWMIIGYFVFASFTASITSALAIEQLRGEISGPADLNGNRVATVAGTGAEAYLAQQGVGPIAVARVEDAYAALEDGEVDAIAFDAPVLQFHAAHDGNGEVRMVGPVFDEVRYGIVVQDDSPLREQMNQALLDIAERGAYDRLHDRWFGATAETDGG